MAIDFGTKRIGIALSDPLHLFAKPFKVLPNTSIPDVIAALKEIIAEQQVAAIVLGIPYSLEGEITAKTEEVFEFRTILANTIDIPMIEWNESLSTVEANNNLKKMGFGWKEAREHIDAMAACMILKSFMESNI